MRNLLLDLDEVLVATVSSTSFEDRIVILQPYLNNFLSMFDGEIFILTHRCRFEASQIVDLYPELNAKVKRIVAAEDLVFFGFRYGAIFDLFKNGIRKSYFCNFLKSNGFDLRSFVFVDDNVNNLNLLKSSGCGSCYCFPRPVINNNFIATFNIFNLFMYENDKDNNLNRVIYLPNDEKYLLSSPKVHSIKKNVCFCFFRKVLKAIRCFFR